VDLVKLLIKFGAQVDVPTSKGEIPLMAAVETIYATLPVSGFSHRRLVRHLLDARASPNDISSNKPPILSMVVGYLARLTDHPFETWASLIDIAIDLLEHGADPNSSINKTSLLHFSLFNNLDRRLVEKLVEEGADCSEVSTHLPGL
jgi:ankyrin repeat protein